MNPMAISLVAFACIFGGTLLGMFLRNILPAIFLICALSVAGSLLLIIELDNPYGGLIKVSSAPLRHALALLSGVATGNVQ